MHELFTSAHEFSKCTQRQTGTIIPVCSLQGYPAKILSLFWYSPLKKARQEKENELKKGKGREVAKEKDDEGNERKERQRC